LGAAVTSTARDAHKRAYYRHITYANAQSTLTAALLQSIGQELTGKIADPITGMFDLTPKLIVDEMFNLYGSISLTNDDIVKLRLRAPLTTRLATVVTFDSHCTLYRHAFAKLERVGQGVPKLEAFNLFSKSISYHPILHHPIQAYHSTHASIVFHDWATLADHILPQIPFLVSSAPTNPFAGLAGVKTPRSPAKGKGRGREKQLTPTQTDLLAKLKAAGLDVGPPSGAAGSPSPASHPSL
jgi:hypothetical protein